LTVRYPEAKQLVIQHHRKNIHACNSNRTRNSKTGSQKKKGATLKKKVMKTLELSDSNEEFVNQLQLHSWLKH